MNFRRISSCLFTSCLVPCLILSTLSSAQDVQQNTPTNEAQEISASASTATVPRLIRMQGTVRDEAGKPLTGRTLITFTLYKDQNDQDPVWQENQNVQLDSTGRYSALLGATNETGLPVEIFSAGEARWIGIRPYGHAEQPRIILLSVAYALKAADAETLGGKPASAYVLASQYQNQSAQIASANSQHTIQTVIPTVNATSGPLLVQPAASCASVTSDGTATANSVPRFTTACNIENSVIFNSGANVGIGTTTPAGVLDVAGTGFFRGILTAEVGVVVNPLGTATTSQGFASSPLYIEASLYNTTLGRPVSYLYNWAAEPTGNDSANTGATLNLQFGAVGSVAETGLSITRNGIINFASGQTFPSSGGTVSNVATGAGLTGGPITTTGTISVATAGITNAMLANNSITVKPGTGLSGGGTVALGGTITLTNSSPSTGGTVTSVASGTGLTGGPITGSGTLSLNTTFTDGRYLQLSGGALTGALLGTTGTFTGALSASALTATTLSGSTGTFSGAVTESGALLPQTGTATAAKGFNSNALDLKASAFSSSTSAAVAEDFRWMTEPTANNTANPSGSLNLLFGSGTSTPAETGLSIASTGLITFAAGQTFPSSGGGGTVTNVATGAGLTGGPITNTGTISIASGGVTNAMLANNSVTVKPGTGLTGGGTVALGGTITITNSAPSLGGTVTSVGSGTGLTGGPITGSGTLNLDTTFTDARYLQLSGGALTGALTGTSATFAGALAASTGAFSGTVSEAGALLPQTGTATATKGFNSNAFDLKASSFSSSTSAAVAQDFRWLAEPTANNTANASGSLNLLFGSGGTTPAETGFSIASSGLVTFAPGQTFPGSGGSGTVTNVATGAGLTGGPITSTGTISIATAGVTNAMLANNSVTVKPGTGLSGGGTVALGGTITITNSAPSLGGTVTSVGSGTGLTGGPITGSGTLNLDTTFTDARYLQLAGGSLTGALAGTSATFAGALSASTGAFSGTVSEAGALLPQTGTATATKGFNSNAFDLKASSFSSASSSAIAQDFRWMAEAAANNTANPSGTLNLLFGSGAGTPAETGLSIASNGLITFAPGQIFPGNGGSGTVTNVATGAGLTGGPITSTGTISIATSGVTNAMLANNSVTVNPGTGLSGGGTVALGGTITITNSAPGLGGTVTSVGSGTGLTGGPITGSGTLNLDTTFTDARYLKLSGGALTGALTGTSAAFTGALSAAAGTFTGTVTEAGALLPQTGAATATNGFNSSPIDVQASSFNSTSASAVAQDFRWMAEPTGNNSASASGSLNLLFGSGGASPAETGFSIASNGVVTFASGQTFPGGNGSGTVTNVATGAGLTGGPITSTGTISIPAKGVTNAMLANSVVTVKAGTGLSGGGSVALGGTITLTNTASGGTVTSVGSGTGLTGGPITGSGTLSLDTTFTDARYLQLNGGILTGALTGTSAAFTSGLSASIGTFTGPVSTGGTLTAAGEVLPQTGAATATAGFNSNPLDAQASSFSSTTSSPVVQDFRWMAEPASNNSANPSASLNLLFGTGGTAPSETGLSIASNGLITFASGQTFPGGGSGGGTVTSVNTGAGLTGGPITGSGTISIPPAGVLNTMLANPSISVVAGAGLSGGGSVALGGTVTLASNLSGTPNGVAYFSNPTSLTSTAAPTNGQILVGSTGNAPALTTLTAGQNISITNGPGSVTISSTGGGGGAPTLPFFVTAGARNGATQTTTVNVNKLWGFLLPYNVTTTEITYSITTKDATANAYDIGIFDASGNLLLNIGPTPGSTFAPSISFQTVKWLQGSTSLAAGKYYLGLTTNCSTTCAVIGAVGSYVSFAANASAGATTNGTLSATITPPADSWSAGNQPVVVIQ